MKHQFKIGDRVIVDHTEPIEMDAVFLGQKGTVIHLNMWFEVLVKFDHKFYRGLHHGYDRDDTHCCWYCKPERLRLVSKAFSMKMLKAHKGFNVVMVDKRGRSKVVNVLAERMIV